MATKTNIEIKRPVLCGSIYVAPGRYVLEDHPQAADLQADIDDGADFIEVLGVVDDTPATKAATGTRRAPKA